MIFCSWCQICNTRTPHRIVSGYFDFMYSFATRNICMGPKPQRKSILNKMLVYSWKLTCSFTSASAFSASVFPMNDALRRHVIRSAKWFLSAACSERSIPSRPGELPWNSSKALNKWTSMGNVQKFATLENWEFPGLLGLLEILEFNSWWRS